MDDEVDDDLFLLLEQVSPEEALNIWDLLNSDGEVTDQELEEAIRLNR